MTPEESIRTIKCAIGEAEWDYTNALIAVNVLPDLELRNVATIADKS